MYETTMGSGTGYDYETVRDTVDVGESASTVLALAVLSNVYAFAYAR